jgi:hypothetical protein
MCESRVTDPVESARDQSITACRRSHEPVVVSVVNQSISRDQSEGSQPDLPRAPINHTVINPCGFACHVTDFFLAGAIGGIRSDDRVDTVVQITTRLAAGAAPMVPTAYYLTGDSGARLPGALRLRFLSRTMLLFFYPAGRLDVMWTSYSVALLSHHTMCVMCVTNISSSATTRSPHLPRLQLLYPYI